MELNYVPSTQRGHNYYGWLETWHLFSFGGWYNPERTNFGALLVLNDDIIQGGGGFDPHSHKNMEIITIPTSGSLAHKDSSGGEGTITFGEVQYMSAGTGVTHSEYNANKDTPVSLFQIWIYPDKFNTVPEYNQISLDIDKADKGFLTAASPDGRENSIKIKQNAFLYLTKIKAGHSKTIQSNVENSGLLILNIEGLGNVNNQKIDNRDSLEIMNWEEVEIKAEDDLFCLLIEIPLFFKTQQ